jgi:hypothetical protein
LRKLKGESCLGTEYIEAIIVFFICIVAFLTLPETYTPALLTRKAKRSQKGNGLQKLIDPDIESKKSLRKVFATHLSRPIR